MEQVRGDLALTYFEFTTLAILHRLASEPLDLVILEVGLGGRLDAVYVMDADCSVITSIDLDHTAYLGPDRESVGREKAHIMRPGRPAIVSDPMPPASIAAYAESIGAEVRQLGRDFSCSGDRQQWQWAGRARRYSGMSYPALRGVNQLLNASGVLAVFEALYERLPISAQAVRAGLALVELPGRFQVIPGSPMLVLDVAHWPHAVAALAQNLDQMGFYPHPCRLRRDGGQGPRQHPGAHLAADRPLAFLRPADRACGDRPGAADTFRRGARRRHAADAEGSRRIAAPDPARRPWPRRRPRRTPLIEFWSSVRSSPWAACSRTASRDWAAASSRNPSA